MTGASRPRITTFTGRVVNPFALQSEDVSVEDIAHALALTNRFGGHSRVPISVAQHAVYVSYLLAGTGYERHGLHHDDAEAYLCDVPKWIKQSVTMGAYREAEDLVQAVCEAAFGVEWTEDAREAVEWADRLMVRYEYEQGYNGAVIDHPAYPKVTAEERQLVTLWRPWAWDVAERTYLRRFVDLKG